MKKIKLDTQLQQFYDHQAALVSRIKSGQAQLVYVDPDGTWMNWVVVIVEYKTGVIYGTQCCGTACDERYIEGFLVPCGGTSFDPDNGFVSSVNLTAPFHSSGHVCTHGWQGNRLNESRLDDLARAISQIPLWHNTSISDYTRDQLEIDLNRSYEICEAWVPVKTRFGPGILLWDNCD